MYTKQIPTANTPRHRKAAVRRLHQTVYREMNLNTAPENVAKRGAQRAVLFPIVVVSLILDLITAPRRGSWAEPGSSATPGQPAAPEEQAPSRRQVAKISLIS